MIFDTLVLKREISEFSKEIGISALGFLKAKPFFRERDRYDYSKSKGFLSGFLKDDSTSYSAIFEESVYKSVISIMVSYPDHKFYKEGMEYEKECRYSPGKVSSSFWGQDYHVVMEDIMEELVSFIKEKTGDFRYELFVDNAPFSEREIAVKAGLGWIGKNSVMINKELGSYVFLGEIFLELDLGEDTKGETDLCQDCSICVSACPVSAIDGIHRVIDTRLCLSQQTQEKEKKDQSVIRAIGKTGYIYGCDICQRVCPYNKKEQEHHPSFTPVFSEVYPDLEELLNMSNREFKNKYGHLAISWRGKRPLAENAKIIKKRKEAR